MKVWFIFLLLVFPMFGNAEEGVRLVCDEPVYEFGTLDQSSVVTNVFKVCNKGDVSFVLKYIRTSCSCTRARSDRRIIGPGETAEIRAVYTAARRRGPQKKAVKLISAQTGDPALMLYMEGFVEPPAESR
jgi:hypothetical protein